MIVIIVWFACHELLPDFIVCIIVVGLRTLLLKEIVFTLCLQMFLNQFFPRNPRVPTTFWKKVPNMPIFGPLVGQIKKALLFDINNIFSIKNRYV